MNKKQLINEYEKKFNSSRSYFQEFKNCFPKGVCHDIRYFYPFPFISEKAEGIYLTDIDNNKLLDLWIGHYTHILGHSNPAIVEAVSETLKKSSHHGTVNIYQYELAKIIKKAIPSIDLLRFCCSGTEATMYATRLAKAFTGKPSIVKIDGGWHGGNSDLAYNIKPPFMHNKSNCLSIPFNNIEGSEKILDKNKEDIGVIIVEPVIGSGGAIAGERKYLQFLRDYTDKYKMLLIFDETITAFRFCYGSVGLHFGITPDLITLGKIIGGGFPVGAYGGKREIMETIEKKHLIMGGGTFSANPVTMTAGHTMLKLLANKNYKVLNDNGEDLKNYLNKIIKDLKINAFASGYGSLFFLIFLKDIKVDDINVKEPSSFLGFINEDMNIYFNIISLINDMFTMHNGGALSFLHIESSIMEQIKNTYFKSLSILKELND
jgi:glutamate-1-semialdehyde 2,1-aminomutase